MNYQELLHSPLIPRQIASLIRKGARSSVPVFILGEKGTKKEVIARIIHAAGEWKSHPFLKLDCSTFAEESFSAELSRLFREIDYGQVPATLYLKDVDSLARPSQMKLLKLLEQRVFQDEGGQKEVRNLRVISSSDEVGGGVQEGKFSSDLYERLSMLLIPLPPLRDRTEEIPSIARYMLSRNADQMKLGATDFSDEVLHLFRNYWWPGNLKEMERVIIRSAHLSEGGRIKKRDLIFEVATGKDSFLSFPKGIDFHKTPFHETNLLSFFIELVHRIKNPLVSVRTFTQLLRERFDDGEFRDYFYRIVTQDIERIDTVLEGLLNYIRISIPVEKADTVRSILEEILKSHESRLQEKKISIIKKLEQDLPETTLHDEQLRYILDSLLRYALPSISANGSIGFLTKLSHEDGRSIEMVIVFDGCRKPTEQIEKVLGIPVREEEAVELELRLVQEIVQKNQGVMMYRVNEEKSRTRISLRLPVERRKVVYYPSPLDRRRSREEHSSG